MKNTTVNTSIRLSKETYEKLKKEAETEKRSITGQIEYIIQKYWEIKKTL